MFWSSLLLNKQHLERLDTLEKSVETLDREMKNAMLDFDEIYEKCRRLMGRIAKRDSREETSPPAAPVTEWEGNLSPGEVIKRRYAALLRG